ncbi:MAG: queuosine precursor transporter [Dysgonamonadaceae bacterium]|nr:queuosine precursor transporter [Dysgonamonadaceae bacterium]
MNGLLFLGWAIVGLSAMTLSYKLFGKEGLIAVIAGSVVMMNILVNKSVVIFGIGATSGNVFYAMVFLATDILSENYGGKEARKSVMIGFFISILTMVGGWVALAMIPAPWDFAHQPLSLILTPMVRIVAGSMVAFFISNMLDTYSYQWLRDKFPKHLWIRNNFSTWSSQLVDSLLFASIALLGTMPMNAWFQVLLSTYLLKVIIAIIDTPFLYMVAKKR